MDDSNVAHDDTAGSTHPLAYIRRRHGWSYQDVARVIAEHARALGVPMAARREKVWRWEHWGVVPEADSQRALARALGVPAKELQTRPWPRWLPAHGGMPDGLPWTVQGSRTALDSLVDDGSGDPRGYPIADGQALRDAIADWDAAGAEGAAEHSPTAAAPPPAPAVQERAGVAACARAAAGAAGGVPSAPGSAPAHASVAVHVSAKATSASASTSASGDRRPAEGASAERATAERVPAQATGPGPDFDVPACVDGPVLEWLEAGALGLRRLDDRLGGAAVRHRVEADLRLVSGLLGRDARGAATQRRLLRVAADLAQLGGWAATDTGRHGAAQRHYLTGLRLAHSAGDR
ncbi:MAG: helix-turn-helix domain-containing protein, partial [Actinomycetia bacterium]|nr:helix-turn-helix domain-containing protein [Actinomycetes bacterium]